MRAVILYSGGLDSTLMLAKAIQDRTCFALSFDYGQRHLVELEAAKELCLHYRVPQKIVRVDPFGAAPLAGSEEVSSHYVPARNTLFLSYALAYAEMLDADEIWFGMNASDTKFPDCSIRYRDAFQQLMDVATAKKGIRLVTPLAHMDKPMIIQEAKALGVPIGKTHSCYTPVGKVPCGSCDACLLRTF